MADRSGEYGVEAIGARALRYGYIGVDRDNIIEIVLSYVGPLQAEVVRLRELAEVKYELVLAHTGRRAERAEKVVHGLQAVWDDLRNCAHAWDPECARCHWLRPLADALQDFERARAHNDQPDEADHGSQSDSDGGGS